MSADADAPIDHTFLAEALDSVFAPWVRDIGLRVVEARTGTVVLALPVAARHVHAGNVMSGQTLMAAADTAMVLAVMSKLGAFRPMTTVQLQTSFLRPVPVGAEPVRITARVLRLGRTLAFGDIAMQLADGSLAAQATTTYALL
jgi:uncharacterized protein (TIGR00369 family)